MDTRVSHLGADDRAGWHAKHVVLAMGTRPEFIKFAPVAKVLGPRAVLVHSGQHFDAEMCTQVQTGLNIEFSSVLEGVGGESRPVQVARALESFARLFDAHRPCAVAVQGDTNTALAAAQAANFQGISVVHLEAGLRSDDRDMPEEINRCLITQLADVHLAPTSGNVRRLLAEGVDPRHVLVTGNTVVEAVREQLRLLPERLCPETHGKVLATFHRPENVDAPAAMRRVVRQLGRIEREVLLVAHPRTRRAIDAVWSSPLPSNVRITEGRSHHDFLWMARDADLVVSDSGGLQEECTVLKRPLLIVRKNTERPECVESGFARLIEPHQDIALAAREVLSDHEASKRLASSPSPFGDGRASERAAWVLDGLVRGLSVEEAVRCATPWVKGRSDAARSSMASTAG